MRRLVSFLFWRVDDASIRYLQGGRTLTEGRAQVMSAIAPEPSDGRASQPVFTPSCLAEQRPRVQLRLDIGQHVGRRCWGGGGGTA